MHNPDAKVCRKCASKMGTKTSLYLDTRSSKDKQGECIVKVRVFHNGKTFFIPTNVRVCPDQWENGEVVKHQQKKMFNTFLSSLRGKIDAAILSYKLEGMLLNMTAEELKKRLSAVADCQDDVILAEREEGDFLPFFISITKRKENSGTRYIYEQTIDRMKAYDPRLARRNFADIDRSWLLGFDKFLAKTNVRNSRNIYFRNIRAVLNEAINEELTTEYPFRKFKLKVEQTIKRSLSVDDLRELWTWDCGGDAQKQEYVDMFKLTFLLIGINSKDMCELKTIRNGRIEYLRSKTHKPYSIKVEPEAKEIIDKYRGEGHLLNIYDRYKNHKDYLHHWNAGLQSLGLTYTGKRGKKEGEPRFAGLTSYWARHTWATLAAELDIPKETISAALGHSSQSVTDTYINFNYKKVDAANRAIIDYVLSEIKNPASEQEPGL